MSSSVTFESILSKYDSFMVPACKIKVGSTQIIGDKDVLLNFLEVKLSLDHTGSAHFSLQGNYDYESSSFPSFLKNNLTLGAVVEISLGYSSTVTMVFKGYIATIDMTYDVENGICFDVIAFDARRLMKTDNRPYTLHTSANYSDIVKTIMSRYSALCSLTSDASSDKLEDPVAQRESDYDFIVNTIIGEGKLSHEFFIVADEAYFRKTKPTQAVITLGITKGLQSFTGSKLYLNRTIEVQGYCQGSADDIRAEVTAKGDDQKNVISAGVTFVVAEDCVLDSKAKEIANNYKELLEMNTKMASGITIGIPEIIPGRYVQIEKLDSLVNDKYYVREVTHTISQEGFTTEFKTKG